MNDKELPRPPRRAQSGDSFSQMPAADRETIFQVLKGLRDDFARYRTDTEKRLDKHDQDIQALKENSVNVQQLALDIRALGGRIDTMVDAVMRSQHEDVVTQRQIGEIKVEMTQHAQKTGQEAGKKSGSQASRKWTALSVVSAVAVQVVLSRIEDCGSQYTHPPPHPTAPANP